MEPQKELRKEHHEEEPIDCRNSPLKSIVVGVLLIGVVLTLKLLYPGDD